jgi:hypothetical protein
MKNYKVINIVTGWITFLVAATVYLLTIEPTASFWDCGEFIATALKLEVGHPPGAPLFMMLGNIFINFAHGKATLMPVMMNSMSALMSAFAILFLFWSITHLAKKMIVRAGEEMTIGQIIAIMGSGLVGALAFTFTDSFWFSAVEGEVYATSAFFTAITFWAILKWENVADEKHADRWIVLIGYLIGLSVGVHLLNLLAIPAIVFVYYFKKFPITKKGIIITFLIGIALLGGVLYGIIVGLVRVASWFELGFVNGLGLPYNTGVIFFLVVLLGLIVYGIYYSHKRGKVVLNTAILTFAVILIGYASYGMIVIRSAAETPMNENAPNNVFALLSYLNRDQYGDSPLFSGPYYNAPIVEEKQGNPTYVPLNGSYKVTTYKPEYVYDDRFTTVFPRMYDRENSHIEAYKFWANIKGRPIQIQKDGKTETVMCPTFGENLKYFFRYQVGWMYFRYFMWNFSGRQDDIEGHNKGILHGNWISGIKFIDEARLGPQDKLPKTMKNNWARNQYYMLPLLLGLIGMCFHYYKDKKDFSIVMLLFFLTGLAIILYLNQKPYEPRERDYAYCGSFYAFAIWIGLGVLAIFEWIRKKVPAAPSAIFATLLCLLCVPTILAKENWNDHDRSGRYTARDFAYNYLNSCDKDAILFTNGDNDTFPLWYAQEVENIRQDVRVVNLSYLGADWYIRQMEMKAYQSDPLPFSLTYEKYMQGNRDMAWMVERIKEPTNLKEVMDFLGSDDPKTKLQGNNGETVDYIPAKNLRITVDKASVIANGTVTAPFRDSVVANVDWRIDREYITKSDIMVLDLLANNKWKRPINFAITVSSENYLNLQDYFRLDGLAYRIVPIKTKRNPNTGEIGSIDPIILYNNMMNKFKWGGVNNPKVYLDENNLRMLSNFRNNFSRLADALIAIGKKDSALKVLDKGMEIMPEERVPFNYYIIPMADAYYRAGSPQKANKILTQLAADQEDELHYYLSLTGDYANKVAYEKKIAMYVLQEIVRITQNYGQKELNDKINKDFQQLFMSYRKNPSADENQPQQQP